MHDSNLLILLLVKIMALFKGSGLDEEARRCFLDENSQRIL